MTIEYKQDLQAQIKFLNRARTLNRVPEYSKKIQFAIDALEHLLPNPLCEMEQKQIAMQEKQRVLDYINETKAATALTNELQKLGILPEKGNGTWQDILNKQEPAPQQDVPAKAAVQPAQAAVQSGGSSYPLSGIRGGQVAEYAAPTNDTVGFVLFLAFLPIFFAFAGAAGLGGSGMSAGAGMAPAGQGIS